MHACTYDCCWRFLFSNYTLKLHSHDRVEPHVIVPGNECQARRIFPNSLRTHQTRTRASLARAHDALYFLHKIFSRVAPGKSRIEIPRIMRDVGQQMEFDSKIEKASHIRMVVCAYCRCQCQKIEGRLPVLLVCLVG